MNELFAKYGGMILTFAIWAAVFYFLLILPSILTRTDPDARNTSFAEASLISDFHCPPASLRAQNPLRRGHSHYLRSILPFLNGPVPSPCHRRFQSGSGELPLLWRVFRSRSQSYPLSGIHIVLYSFLSASVLLRFS